MTAGDSVRIRLLHRGHAPPSPDGDPWLFGLQDTKGDLSEGRRRADGVFVFDFELTVKAHPSQDRPVFGGPFASGPRDDRFVYLSWKRLHGVGYINRVKARLADIDWALVRAAQTGGKVLEADLTGRMAGGGRVPVVWRLADPAP